MTFINCDSFSLTSMCMPNSVCQGVEETGKGFHSRNKNVNVNTVNLKTFLKLSQDKFWVTLYCTRCHSFIHNGYCYFSFSFFPGNLCICFRFWIFLVYLCMQVCAVCLLCAMCIMCIIYLSYLTPQVPPWSSIHYLYITLDMSVLLPRHLLHFPPQK